VPRLISRKIIFEVFQLDYNTSTSRHRRTDGRLAVSPGLRIHAVPTTCALTYLYRITSVFSTLFATGFKWLVSCDLAFQRMICFPFHCLDDRLYNNRRTYSVYCLSIVLYCGIARFALLSHAICYRAMHFSAYARSWERMSSVCLSVCPSVCDVGGL